VRLEIGAEALLIHIAVQVDGQIGDAHDRAVHANLPGPFSHSR
jgi:hypothetical protein